jgi:sigma-B regulation protein RsbU (phosphoserine phosphatase)
VGAELAGDILLMVLGVAAVALTQLSLRSSRRSLLARALARTSFGRAAGGSVAAAGAADEVDVLADAMQGWIDAYAEREILIDQVPVGICRVDAQRRLVQVNAAMAEMLGYTKEELTGRTILDINPPEDHGRAIAAHDAFMHGQRDLYVSERRWLRKDGSSIWCSLRVAPVRPREGGPPASLIAISEDVTERRRQSRQAAEIQRQLLPREVPTIEGYDLAGVCLPAQEVSGDFYDWVVTEGGQVDVTVADVMGKGMAAALVMATVRATLRAAPAALGPAARARLAGDSLALGITDEGMFVTLFHCRLDPASGTLRYVDAGHGYCAIRGPDGAFVHLANGSLPLGVLESDERIEGVARLEPGATLVVYSDGLVETEERTADLAEYAADFDEAEDAAATVARLMSRMASQPADDVTIVVLRRLPA